MEALLSLGFDNIASKDTQKIRKGLRQIEGMLAQICLSGGKSKPSTPSHRRNASAINLGEQQSPKKLSALSEDLAFREFFRLQEGFEWNVATRVVDCLERLLGMASTRSDGQNDLLILSALSNLQGLLLLHPPSRTIFGREIYMNMLLDLLDPYNCPAIQSSTLLVLVTALLATPQNTRTFESIDGLLTITSLFKSDETTQNVKLKLLEFLYFYLMPEVPVSPASAPNTAMGLHRSPSKLVSAFEKRNSTVSGDDPGGASRKNIRTQEEKQHLLGRYLNNVEGLVQDLRETAPFTPMAC
ncbi:cell division control protein 14 [Lindgomyces ingoldianus]|uniref:Cell division control protein 14 n=1 Tax=Lindgomyces ingoldianus TaxID=673940 RepID=A0ACB6QRQ5_9PLEO|nr:cell division control protein 14 [Lindgomyces ingoldianus]KAF2468785.1 cell division control protein 14 [Lindgomyces ingoldianus]